MSNRLKRKRRKANVIEDSSDDDDEENAAYMAYSTVPYPLNQHPKIDGEFWCCSCTKEPHPKDGLELCKTCENALFHKECGEKLGGQCPRCKYHKNWSTHRFLERGRVWTEEDNIRLIVLCSEGKTRNTIRRDMNVSFDRIEDKIKDLVIQKRVIYERKKIHSDEDYDNDDSASDESENEDTASKETMGNRRWTPKEDERLIKLFEANTDDCCVMNKLANITPLFNQNGKIKRTTLALYDRRVKLRKLMLYDETNQEKSRKGKKKRKGVPRWSQADDNLLLKLMKYDANGNSYRKAKDFRAIHAKFNEKADYKGRSERAMGEHYGTLVEKIEKVVYRKTKKRKRKKRKESFESDTKSMQKKSKRRKKSYSQHKSKHENKSNEKPTKEKKANNALHIPQKNLIEEGSVEIWLKQVVGLPQYLSNFVNEGYDDLDVIINRMTDDDLLAIGINLRGHRAKILHHIDLKTKKECPD